MSCLDEFKTRARDTVRGYEEGNLSYNEAADAMKEARESYARRAWGEPSGFEKEKSVFSLRAEFCLAAFRREDINFRDTELELRDLAYCHFSSFSSDPVNVEVAKEMRRTARNICRAESVAQTVSAGLGV